PERVRRVPRAVWRPPDATPVRPPLAPAGFRYELFGLLRLKGGFIQDDPNVAFVGRNDGFTLQNARLGLQGSWERLFFRFSAEGAVDDREGQNATSGTLQFALKDAFVDVTLADFLTLRLVRRAWVAASVRPPAVVAPSPETL